MILTLNTKFEGYTPVQVLGKSTSYREVYLAKNSFEQDVVLTVYDMSKLPECFTDGKIPEFEIIPQLTNEAFPSYIERGTYNNDEVSLQWLTTKYIDGTTLSEYIHSDYVRNERTAQEHLPGSSRTGRSSRAPVRTCTACPRT